MSERAEPSEVEYHGTLTCRRCSTRSPGWRHLVPRKLRGEDPPGTTAPVTVVCDDCVGEADKPQKRAYPSLLLRHLQLLWLVDNQRLYRERGTLYADDPFLGRRVECSGSLYKLHAQGYVTKTPTEKGRVAWGLSDYGRTMLTEHKDKIDASFADTGQVPAA